MKEYLILFGGIAAVIFIVKILKNPVWGVVLVFLVNPLEPLLPDIGGMSVGRLVGMFTAAIWFYYLAKNPSEQKKVFSSSLLKQQRFFQFSVLLSGLFWLLAPDGLNALLGALTFLILGILALMLENLIKDLKSLRMVCTAMALASALACIPAFLFVFGIDVYTPLGAEAPTDLSEETLRSTSLGGNPNGLGIIARNGIFAAVMLLISIKSKPQQILSWSLLLICFAGLVLSGSRTNFYGTLMLITIMIGFGALKEIKNWFRLTLILIGTSVVGFVAFQLAPEPVKIRLLLGQGDERIAERAESRRDFTRNQQGQAVDFLTINPILGVGLDRTYYSSGKVIGAHDTISVIVGETGLFGTIGFIWIIVWSLKRLWRTLKRTRDYKMRLRISLLLGMLLSMVVMGFSGGLIIPYDRSFWMVLGLIRPIMDLLNKSEFMRKQRFIEKQKLVTSVSV